MASRRLPTDDLRSQAEFGIRTSGPLEWRHSIMADKPRCDRDCFLTGASTRRGSPETDADLRAKAAATMATSRQVVTRIPLHAGLPRLQVYAERCLKISHISLDEDQAVANLDQFLVTADHRRRLIAADAENHVHAYIGARVPGNPNPETILDDLNVYASREPDRG